MGKTILSHTACFDLFGVRSTVDDLRCEMERVDSIEMLGNILGYDQKTAISLICYIFEGSSRWHCNLALWTLHLIIRDRPILGLITQISLSIYSMRLISHINVLYQL